MKLINLTPHPLTLFGATEEPFVIQKEPQPARVTEETVGAGFVIPEGGSLLPIFNVNYGDVEGLPEPRPGVFYIVSAQVRLACPERDDIFSPTNYLRDADGNIVGARGSLGILPGRNAMDKLFGVVQDIMDKADELAVAAGYKDIAQSDNDDAEDD